MARAQGPVVFHDGRYNGRSLEEWVPEIVSRIAERFQPLRIVLFGSLARGAAGRDSDVDLLVVLPTLTNKRRVAVELRSACRGIPVPMDLIPTDPNDIEKRKGIPGSVVRAALREGTVLYERGSI